VAENIEHFIKSTKSRLIIGTFASQVERILAIIKMAEKHKGMKRSDEAKRKMSLAKKGMISKGRKLSNDDIIKIRHDYISNIQVPLISEFGKELVYKSAFCKHYSKIYNVSVSRIRHIIDYKSYSEVK
jgi:mRNA degradation ribonuclease J1/J2